jgi:hypothetical protein
LALVLAASPAWACGGDDTQNDAATPSAPTDADPSDPPDAMADAAVPPPPCTVDPPVVCVDPSSSYADVEPIFMRRCLSCHDGSTEQWPLTSYSHVADWFDQIRSAMRNCTMPPPDSGMTMTIEEREAILQWIRCGFRS